MKTEKNEMKNYEAPQVEVIEVEVEHGFEASAENYRYGGNYDE
jgi:hypothetical protein